MVFLIPLIAFASIVGGSLVLYRWSGLSKADKIRYDQQFRTWVCDTYNESLATQVMAEQFAREHPEAVERFKEEYQLRDRF